MVSQAKPNQGSFTFREQDQLDFAQGAGRGILADKTNKSLLDNNASQTSIFTKDSAVSRLPRTYHELQKCFVVKLQVPSKQVPNMAVGEIMVSKIPQGKYKIYYLRPRDRVRQINSSQSRL